MGKIVAIGGVTPPLTLDLIDEEIIRLTGRKNPKVLYVPTAGGDNLDYCEFFKGIYEGRFGCDVDVLFLVINGNGEVTHKNNTNRGIILIDANNQCWRLSVDITGNLTTQLVTCP